MKLKYLPINILTLTVVVLLAFAGCNSTATEIDPGGNGDQDSTDHPIPPDKQGITIEKALFTNPRVIRKSGNDPSVMNQLITYLDNSPKGATVHINIFAFTYKPVLHAVERASNRGVIIKILIDNKRGNNKKTISELQKTLRSPSEVIPVHNDTRSNGASIDHNKYALFSKVELREGTAYNVVWAGSHNFTFGQTGRLQDAIVMTNKSLYNAFISNWKEIKSLADHGMKNFEYSPVQIGDSITAFFFPRLKNGKWDGKSTVIEQLNKLEVSPKDTVCMLYLGISDEFGYKTTQKLASMAFDGVNVQVITNLSKTTDKVRAELKSIEDAGGDVKLLDASKEGTDHSKTMLIKGLIEGKMQHIIFTGSLNLNVHATKGNNNFVLMLKNSALFDDYWKNFQLVKRIF